LAACRWLGSSLPRHEIELWHRFALRPHCGCGEAGF